VINNQSQTLPYRYEDEPISYLFIWPGKMAKVRHVGS